MCDLIIYSLLLQSPRPAKVRSIDLDFFSRPALPWEPLGRTSPSGTPLSRPDPAHGPTRPGSDHTTHHTGHPTRRYLTQSHALPQARPRPHQDSILHASRQRTLPAMRPRLITRSHRRPAGTRPASQRPALELVPHARLALRIMATSALSLARATRHAQGFSAPRRQRLDGAQVTRVR